MEKIFLFNHKLINFNQKLGKFKRCHFALHSRKLVKTQYLVFKNLTFFGRRLPQVSFYISLVYLVFIHSSCFIKNLQRNLSLTFIYLI